MSRFIAYLVATFVVAAIDGAFLGGVAAVISAIGTIILGLLAYRQGRRKPSDGLLERAVVLEWMKEHGVEAPPHIERRQQDSGRGIRRDRRSH